MPFDPLLLLIYGLPLLIAIPLHEAAHGWVADKCGDKTARLLGRVTFNPIRHIDPIGTVVMPAILIAVNAPFLFGWAKPVPVNFTNLNRPRRDMALVAAAGPAINLLLAFASVVALALAEGVKPGDTWSKMLIFSLMLNVSLAIFNLLPLLPLDGGRILNALLPRRLAAQHARSERFGLFLLIVVLVIPPIIGNLFGKDWGIFHQLIGAPIFAVAEFMMRLVGLS